jgi:hypothetical protein
MLCCTRNNSHKPSRARNQEKKMFDVAARRRMPTALAAHITSFLDLTTYSCLKRVSHSANGVCRERAASPAIVCCRNLAMNIVAPPPRERYIQRTERIYKKMHDVHKKTYSECPSPLYVSESGCELERILPTVILDKHTLWEGLAPRVLDLHHVRLQSITLAEIVRRMPALRMLCMNVRDIPQLSILQNLTALQSLCLYSVSDQATLYELGELTSLRQLTFPMTPSFRACIASPHHIGRPMLPSQLTRLTLWRDPFDEHPTQPINWQRLLAAVPHLQHLTTYVLLPSISVILPLVPELRELKGLVREQTTIEFVRPVPFARQLTVLDYTSMAGRCPKVTQLLNPETLVELTWQHFWGRDLLAEMLVPLITDIARFRQLRILRLFVPVYALDATAFERLCRSLPLLEMLAVSALQTGRPTQPPIASELTVRDDGARFLQPLALLERLTTLHFSAIRNISDCELPHLPQLTEYATSAAPTSGRTIHGAFPNLVTLVLSAPMNGLTMNDLARLRFLRRLNFQIHGAVDTATLLTFARARSQHAPHQASVIVEVAWCHNPLCDDVETTQSGIVVRLTDSSTVQCVCPPSLHDVHHVCRHQLDLQPYSEEESAEIRAIEKDH